MKIAPLLNITSYLSVCCVLCSCSSVINDIPSPIKTQPTFSQTGEQAVMAQWWLAFKDPQLNQLIHTAFAKNFNLLAAYSRLEQAQQFITKSQAALIPSVTLFFDGKKSDTNKGQSSPFSLGLNTSYELDLWGRIRATANAAQLDYQASAEDIKTAALSLSTEIALTWYRLIEQRSQLALLQQQINTNKDNLSLLHSRFASSKASAEDVLQQQQILEATRGNQHTVNAAITVLSYQLAILTGNTPQHFKAPQQTQLPDLPPQPQTGLTTELIQRRPDLKKAYLQIQAADQRIAAAIADRFPKFSLTTTLNANGANLQSLFNNWLATLAGNLILPLIDGGRRKAEVNKQRAIVAERLNRYANNIQIALKEVEDALIQEQQQQRLINSLKKQLHLSKQAYQQIRMRYIYGSGDFLRVLSIQLSQQSLEQKIILAQRQAIEYRLQLYKALSGGWDLTKDVKQ